jgi:toxin ParE1/3/4
VKLVWSDHARDERGDIMIYIAADNPVAAIELDELFMERAINLQRFPYIGRPGILADTRELTVHPNYRLIYEVAEDTVRILNVIHARREWPE